MSIIIIRENVISPNIKKNDFWAKSKRGEGTVGFFQNSREPLKLKCKRNIKIQTFKGGNRFRLLKKSNFCLCHKLLVKLSKNMFPKFQ